MTSERKAFHQAVFVLVCGILMRNGCAKGIAYLAQGMSWEDTRS